ncbi:hypothetical protein ZYGR_0AD05640 [Zygosaccharomyces rouxii]|uniref:ZYRO0G19030p n=2 Tax=Zygosaccharomyces rouxii TaxID=4956 RepID=C5E191_ZYGRC|nr:uncharacterized protein ZYRO0G19030g [Zygosaccharomyces rouxii]KAH9202868.1 VPS4-associated protein 1 [Zygosaccharomyces rouxii]GAV51381.1 hypothetical protein ZYGR_0AD05640 [Zygosaccharomyces rouxii]CAR29875.1 ZYRO0G19030p [Zygosaccharomyces rouxii]
MKNEYTARKVGIKDMQPCVVCYKPTTTVLYSGIDWFYTCDIHLQDNPQFVTPLYSKEYQDAVAKLKALKPLPATNSGSGLDGWVSKFLKKDKKEKHNGGDGDGNGDGDGDGEKTTKDKDQGQELQRQYDEQLDLVSKLQRQNRKYQLSRTVFDSRIQRKQMETKWKEQKRIEDESYTNTDPLELETKFVFPSVPKS